MGFGLAFAFYAVAQTNIHTTTGYGPTANLNLLEKSTIHNTTGYPSSDFILQIPIKQVSKRTYKATGSFCNCVLWAQANGLNISGYGAAKNYPINSLVPSQTGFVITYESRPGTNTGHIAKYFLEGTNIRLQEDNFYGCVVTSTRLLPINSTLIKGYINEISSSVL